MEEDVSVTSDTHFWIATKSSLLNVTVLLQYSWLGRRYAPVARLSFVLLIKC